MKIMDFPFIGGRIKPDFLTRNLIKNLKLKIKETSFVKKAWNNIKVQIDNGNIVGIKLDGYYLDYFTSNIHFAAHYVAIHDYDNEFVYLVDTEQQGSKVRTTLKNFELARNAKGLMSSKNLSYTIKKINGNLNLKDVIKIAIYNNAKDYLNPPINNIGYKGILKTSKEISKWFENSNDIKRDFQTTAMLMEQTGTGGSIFRNFYRDFLKDSYRILKTKNIQNAYLSFVDIADLWKKVAICFGKAGNTKKKKYINEASEILITLADKEKTTMESL